MVRKMEKTCFYFSKLIYIDVMYLIWMLMTTEYTHKIVQVKTEMLLLIRAIIRAIHCRSPCIYVYTSQENQ